MTRPAFSIPVVHRELAARPARWAAWSALVWANIAARSYYRFSHALDFAVNDVGIAFFFGIMTKEVVEATLAGGVLHSWRRARCRSSRPSAASPCRSRSTCCSSTSCAEPMLVSAWAVDERHRRRGVLSRRRTLIFGRHRGARLPAADVARLRCDRTRDHRGDESGRVRSSRARRLTVVVVGVGARDGCSAGDTDVVLAVPRWARACSAGPGCFSRRPSGARARAGCAVHAARPARRRPVRRSVAETTRDALSRFDRWWAPPVQAVLFLFGVVNAGVPLHGLEAGMWALPVATIIGRPIGVARRRGTRHRGRPPPHTARGLARTHRHWPHRRRPV